MSLLCHISFRHSQKANSALVLDFGFVFVVIVFVAHLVELLPSSDCLLAALFFSLCFPQHPLDFIHLFHVALLTG